METTTVQTNYKLIISHDNYPMNPFTDYDYEPPLVYGYDRDMNYPNSKNIESELLDIIREKKITLSLDMLPLAVHISKGYIDYQIENRYDNESDCLYDTITDEKNYASIFDMYQTLANLADVPYIIFDSHGYSQGDNVKGMFFLTPNYIQTTGVNPEDKDSIFSESIKLFSAYMFGDVYTYDLIECTPLYRADGTLSNQVGEETIDTCRDLYGTDNLLDNIKGNLSSEYHHLIQDAIDNMEY